MTVKSPGLVPTLVIVKVSGPVPVFARVKFCTAVSDPMVWFPNAIDEGVKLTTGAMPVTERLATCGLPGALSTTLTIPFTVPVVTGVAVTLMVQLAAAAMVEGLIGQLCVSENGLPVVMLLMMAAAPPLLVKVIVEAEEGTPTSWLPKFTVPGPSVICAGRVPVPESAAVFGEVEALEATDSVPLKAPEATGLKKTVIVQLEEAGKIPLAGQVLLCENEGEPLAPVN